MSDTLTNPAASSPATGSSGYQPSATPSSPTGPAPSGFAPPVPASPGAGGGNGSGNGGGGTYRPTGSHFAGSLDGNRDGGAPTGPNGPNATPQAAQPAATPAPTGAGEGQPHQGSAATGGVPAPASVTATPDITPPVVPAVGLEAPTGAPQAAPTGLPTPEDQERNWRAMREQNTALQQQLAALSPFAPYIEKLKAQGLTDAQAVESLIAEQAAQQEDARIYNERLTELQDTLVDPAQAAQQARYEIELRQRERDAAQLKAQSEQVLGNIQQQHRNQQYDQLLAQVTSEIPVLQEFGRPAAGTGLAIGQKMLNTLRNTGQFTPEQLAAIGREFGSELRTALEAHASTAESRVAERLAQTRQEAPQVLSPQGGGAPPAALPSHYQPTGTLFSRFLGDRRTN